MRSFIKTFTIVFLCAAMLFCAACVNTEPRYYPDVTPRPTEEPTEAPTVPPEAISTPEPTATPSPTQPRADAVDALGVPISGADHFIRYVTFTDMIVYEENGGTFLDGIIVNSYPEPIVCAVSIAYYDDGGGELARAQLQMRDGKYLLVLAPGENTVFATILTDMTLVGLEFKLEFDPSTGVHPQ